MATKRLHRLPWPKRHRSPHTLRRTRRAADIVADAINFNGPIEIDERLHAAGALADVSETARIARGDLDAVRVRGAAWQLDDIVQQAARADEGDQ